MGKLCSGEEDKGSKEVKKTLGEEMDEEETQRGETITTLTIIPFLLPLVLSFLH